MIADSVFLSQTCIQTLISETLRGLPAGPHPLTGDSSMTSHLRAAEVFPSSQFSVSIIVTFFLTLSQPYFPPFLTLSLLLSFLLVIIPSLLSTLRQEVTSGFSGSCREIKGLVGHFPKHKLQQVYWKYPVRAFVQQRSPLIFETHRLRACECK